MYWYNYNKTIPLLNIVKIIWYIIFKISKFSTILSASQPAPIRPGSISAMATDFSHKKGNGV